jgi:hypothetical protein
VLRHVLNAISTLSLLVALAIAVVWVRSYAAWDVVMVSCEKVVITFTSQAGSLVVNVQAQSADSPPFQRFTRWESGQYDAFNVKHRLPNFESDDNVFDPFGWTVVLHHWAVCGALAIAPTARFALLLRRRRNAAASGFPVQPAAISSPPP